MKHTRWLILAASICLLATPRASHAAWNIGTDFGLSFFSPEEGDGITTVGWGSGMTTLLPVFQPGLRVGFQLGGPSHELVTTSSLALLAVEDETLRTFQAMVGYQHNFSVDQPMRLFVNGGLGLNSLGDDDDNFTALAFGAGFGVRRMLGSGHGALRFEGRIDHQMEFEEDDVTVFPAANVFGVKIGWELWD
ncbi:MAG: hypothetical protein HOP12_05510 [Candidatus Eisenbacteria bacterium]|uniref:Outer membrane protein beta-barrel domain-containing protein n=1 Tax=Eiseniibacteriota bacterium TaxID=2212470 RepID=A0A849SJ12_UNCEI|nr:hypothetical protein [Candidatus Eisenbacteria bacterium]